MSYNLVEDPSWMPQWKAEPLFDRAQRCCALLFIHGLITPQENVRIQRELVEREAKSDA